MTYIDHVVCTLRGVWGRFLMIMVACWVIGAAMGLSAYAYSALKTPVAIGTVQELDGIAIRGGYLELLITTTRSRYCEADVHRWMTLDTGRRDLNGRPILEYAALGPAAAPVTPAGEQVTYLLRVPLPPAVNTPGKWLYQSDIGDRCPLLPLLDRAPRRAATPVTVTAGDLAK